MDSALTPAVGHLSVDCPRCEETAQGLPAIPLSEMFRSQAALLLRNPFLSGAPSLVSPYGCEHPGRMHTVGSSHRNRAERPTLLNDDIAETLMSPKGGNQVRPTSPSALAPGWLSRRWNQLTTRGRREVGCRRPIAGFWEPVMTKLPVGIGDPIRSIRPPIRRCLTQIPLHNF